MGNKSTFVKQLQTGNLPFALVQTARTYNEAKDTKDWKADSGNRLAFVGFKMTDKQAALLADGATIPSSFAVQVPIVNYTELGSNRAGEFLDCLVQDYQDKMIAASANKTTAINPIDFSALIADYFDSSRGGLTQATIKEWCNDVFELAMMMRQVELNQTAAAESRKVKTDAEMEALAKGYKSYLLAILPKDSIVGHAKLKATRQTIERLVETKHLEGNDECALWFLEKIELLLKTDESVIEAAI